MMAEWRLLERYLIRILQILVTMMFLMFLVRMSLRRRKFLRQVYSRWRLSFHKSKQKT